MVTEGLPSAREIHVTTDSGILIVGTLYPASGTHARKPGLVLLPDRGATRESLEVFAREAQRSGILCLAIDLPTQPASSLDGRLRPGELSTTLDILVEYGAQTEDVGVMGVGTGADLALHFAAADARVQAVVLISPATTYAGLPNEDAIRSLGARPVLLLTATGDAHATAASRALDAAAGGFCELREYPGGAHGADLLAQSEGAMGQVLLWLSEIIGPVPPGEQSTEPAD
jgi:dienelactone hydrolase